MGYNDQKYITIEHSAVIHIRGPAAIIIPICSYQYFSNTSYNVNDQKYITIEHSAVIHIRGPAAIINPICPYYNLSILLHYILTTLVRIFGLPVKYKSKSDKTGIIEKSCLIKAFTQRTSCISPSSRCPGIPESAKKTCFEGYLFIRFQ